MTRRYVARPKGWGSETEYGWLERPNCTVFEMSREPVDTGLLDANGTKLWRVDEPDPIGFRVEAKG